MNNPKLAERYEKRKRINKDNIKLPEVPVKNNYGGPNYPSMNYYDKVNPNYFIYNGMVNANGSKYVGPVCPDNSSPLNELKLNYAYNESHFYGNVAKDAQNNNYMPSVLICANCRQLMVCKSNRQTYYGWNQNQNSLILNCCSNCINNLNLNKELNLSLKDNPNYLNYSGMEDAIGKNYPSPVYSDDYSSLNGLMLTYFGCYQNQDSFVLNDSSNSKSNLNLNKELNTSLENCNNISSISENIDKKETIEGLSGTGNIPKCDINIILIVPDNKSMEEPIEVKMKKEITYSDMKKGIKGKNGKEVPYDNQKEEPLKRVKLNLKLGSINRVFPNLTLLVVEQTNTKTKEVKEVEMKYDVCIKGKENIEIILKTNQGEDKYETKLSFMDENGNVRLIISELKTLTTRALRNRYKEKKDDFMGTNKKETGLELREKERSTIEKIIRYELISELKKEGMNDLREIFYKILDSYELVKLKDLKKFLINEFKKLGKNEKFNREMIKKFQEKGPSEKKKDRVEKIEYLREKIKGIYDIVFRSHKLGLYISCFECIYKCIIDKINNTGYDHDGSITRYFCHDCSLLKFIKNFNIGFCSDNDIIIFAEEDITRNCNGFCRYNDSAKFTNSKRRADLEENEVGNLGKRQKKDDAKKIVYDIPINDSDSEEFIS